MKQRVDEQQQKPMQNKTDKHLAQLTRETETENISHQNHTSNKRQDITAHLREIKCIIKEIYEKVYVSELDQQK